MPTLSQLFCYAILSVARSHLGKHLAVPSTRLTDSSCVCSLFITSWLVTLSHRRDPETFLYAELQSLLIIFSIFKVNSSLGMSENPKPFIIVWWRSYGPPYMRSEIALVLFAGLKMKIQLQTAIIGIQVQLVFYLKSSQND